MAGLPEAVQVVNAVNGPAAGAGFSLAMLGHPLRATSTKLTAASAPALRARGRRRGPQTMCEGGGLANVTISEAL